MDIDTLTRTELIELNNRIVARLESMDELEVQAKRQQFTLGSPAEFVDDKGTARVCVVVKFNKKTISVSTVNGERWNIPADRLRPLANA
ncbi:TPA: hypothetical protein I7181_22485 [Vibrio vulnificus]|uniref:hypothetical protein n=1 Tax=uncultured Vibrio sp. TaxID=114054 RepID=UPI001A280D13|nr:hypothetical protein [uncultured Vibrio sp.]HAS6240183.1 hypothetical protein [Vibrio vulnificus]HAT8488865.1 hypothetical protein [Vibrio vulnificus]HAT8516424.1 hypothetical protein [Vibrio vulnificus]